jgi:hypothetical protein
MARAEGVAQASAILRGAVPRITEALRSTGEVSWQEMRQAMIESRLRRHGELGLSREEAAEHGVVDGFADVGAFGELLEVTEAGGFGEVEDALGLIVGFADGAAASGLGGEAGFGEVEFVIGVAEEDEAEDGDGVFGGFEFGVGAEVVGGGPESFFEFGGVGRHVVRRIVYWIGVARARGPRRADESVCPTSESGVLLEIWRKCT